jgi:DNA-binding phage protein
MAGVQERETGGLMPITKKFSDTVATRLRESPTFCRALLREAVGCLINGDVDTGKIVLRDYINGTIGFAELGKALGHSPAVLIRMLEPKGNPPLRKFLEVTTYLQKMNGNFFEVVDKKAA